MDDFLHNLRSGKLKQGDRSNRPYNDQQFKGGQRRNLDNRRNKGHFENKDSFERLSAIKEVLESLVESQKQMTEAYHARTRAEERKAKAMEVIAKNLYRVLNPNATDAEELFAHEQQVNPLQAIESLRNRATIPNAEASQHHSVADQDEEIESDEFSSKAEASLDEIEEREARSAEAAANEESEEEILEEAMNAAGEDRLNSARLAEEDRRKLFKVIDRLRTDGQGWEKIARHLASEGYPTISGKGTWRGIMVKNLHEKMAS